MSKRVLAWVAAALCATAAWAEDWQTVAELTAGDGTHEVALDRTVRVIGIEGVSGAATVAAVVVREGEAENPVAVERAFPPGEVQDAAKMGALLSFAAAGVSIVAGKLCGVQKKDLPG